MATITKAKRDASEATNVPVRIDGKLDMAALLLEMLDMPGSMSKAFNRFHKYSLMNMFLVYLQTGKAEPTASFNKWKSLKRTVSKGSKALFVNHPKFAPVRDPKTNEIIKKANGKPEMKVVGFQLRPTVFQMWQTEGDELKMPELPAWDYNQALDALNITEVPFAQDDGNIGGYSFTDKDGHKIAINPVNPGMSPLSTAIHEIAHVVLGHTDPEFAKSGKYSGEHRGVAEFQAEATAYLVMHELEVPFPTSESRGYVQNWLQGRESDWLNWDDGNLELVQDKVIRKILKAADDIVVAGRKKHFDKLAADEQSEMDSRPPKPRTARKR